MTLSELAAAYQADQANLDRVAAAQLLAVFPALDLKDIDRTAPGWVFAVERVTGGHFARSQELAADLYSDYRRAAGVKSQVAFVFSDMDGGKLRASLTYQGVYAGKHMLSAGGEIPEVAKLLFANTSGIALRHGKDGGRELIKGTGRRDQASTGFGYIRATGAKPCGFCAMKALTTYNSEATAGQDFHDHDQCYALPRVKDAFPEGYRERMGEYETYYGHAVVDRPDGARDSKATIRNMNRIMRQVHAGTWDEFA